MSAAQIRRLPFRGGGGACLVETGACLLHPNPSSEEQGLY